MEFTRTCYKTIVQDRHRSAFRSVKLKLAHRISGFLLLGVFLGGCLTNNLTFVGVC